MNKTAVFTIVSKNYLHFARTLLKSVKKCNPSWEQYVLLVDEIKDDFNPEEESFQIKLVSELDLPNIHQFLFRYAILELNTAVKPWMFEWLFKQKNYDRVIYLDPDIFVYDSMDEVEVELNSGTSMVLTPHITDFLDDDKKPGEIDILKAGSYNLGFLALAKSQETYRFLNWWKKKLEHDCVVDFENGLFVDQKWMDLAIGLFANTKILRHPGYNVAYWNLNHRNVEERCGKFYVNGERLVFFHFSGLNPSDTTYFSKHQDRFVFNNLNSVLKSIVSNYSKEVLNSGYETLKNSQYNYANFSNGVRIVDSVRKTYRKNLEVQTRCGSDPFQCATVFITEQARENDRNLPIITPLMQYIWETRGDLQGIFLDIWNRDRTSYCQWFIDNAEKELGLTKDYVLALQDSLNKNNLGLSIWKKSKIMLLRVLSRFAIELKPFLKIILSKSLKDHLKRLKRKLDHSYRAVNDCSISPRIDKSKCQSGINLIGYARAEMGIGESCRLLARSINTSSVPFGIINFDEGNSARMSDLSWQHKEISKPIYKTNIIAVNADQTPVAYTNLGASNFQGHYNIGSWFWELPDFPDEWLESFKYVQEVWVATNFIMDSVSRKSSVPVVRIPLAIELDLSPEFNRQYFKLPPNKFLFLSMYDSHSYQQRKNPQAVVEAFKTAFGDNSSVGLVLKVNNAKSNPREIAKLQELIAGYKNIFLIETTLSRIEVNGLLNSTDCFVSLHRSEGFGLGLAEAMYLGKPVIGTAWSGNVDFMNNMNSCPVNYSLINVGADYGPYKAYQIWADPDIEHAAYFMRKLVSDLPWSQTIARKGQEIIRTDFSPKVVGEMIAQRLKTISTF